MRTMGLVVGLAVLVGGGIYLLREATMSTHYDTGPDSRLEVVVRAASNRAEPGVTLDEQAEAHLRSCVLEVASRAVAVTPIAGTDDRFAITLQPALDSTDRKQYRGCLEDWSTDHLRMSVVAMTDAGSP